MIHLEFVTGALGEKRGQNDPFKSRKLPLETPRGKQEMWIMFN